MASTVSLPLPVRAWRAIQRGGWVYAQHKALRRLLAPYPAWKRRLVYQDPRQYWTLRGGVDYFAEQEHQPARSARSAWLASAVARFQPQSILEVGCGYGKQLRSLRNQLDAPLVGVDFSPSQLALARSYLDGLGAIALVQGSGQCLPFADKSFDLVLTSAVILHNPPPEAERIRHEILRVARRFAVHNEDTDVTYNRYGYDTAGWYHARGIPLVACCPIPVETTGTSQFCVADLRRS